MSPVGAVVDISSDEEDLLMGNDSPLDPIRWASDLFDVDGDAVGEDIDDLMVMSELSSPPAMQKTSRPDDLVVMAELPSQPALQKKVNADDGPLDEDEDDCVVLDGDPDKVVTVADEEGSAGDGSSDELQIVAEKGPVACRDFPHSRHLCSNLPFSNTSHVKYCSMCHCFVCDTQAPCKYWGSGALWNDHCHATDKEEKWKTMRKISKCKYQQFEPEKHQNGVCPTMTSARQQPMQCQVAVSQSLPSSVSHVGRTSLAIQSPVLNEGSQNQQRHPSVRVSLSVGGAVSSPRAGRGTGHAHIAQNTHSRAIFKRAGAVSPGSAPKTASQFGSTPDDSLMNQAFPHVSQPIQVAPPTNAFTGTAQNNPFQRSFSAPIAHVQQGQAAAYCQVATTGVHVAGPQLSRCTSLITERTQYQPEPAIDVCAKSWEDIPAIDVCTKSWEDILASVASDLEVQDYNISPAEPQHVMADTQSLHSNGNQGFALQPESVAAADNLTSSHMQDLSNNATVGNVQPDGPMQTTLDLDHQIRQSSLVPNEAHLNDFAIAPADRLLVEEAAHQLEIARLDSTNILFEFDWG